MKIFIGSMMLISAWLEATSSQLLVVRAKDWNSTEAVFQRYEKKEKHWIKIGEPFVVIIGRNGLGWGRGVHTIPSNAQIIKREGDGKSPAGIFKLTHAFGYSPLKSNFPYRVYNENDHCVDDTRSRYYNKIIDSDSTSKDYQSYESMRLSNDYYKYGIVVDHNGIGEGETPLKGAGSCIFIHIKPTPTSGCTAMTEKEILELIQWLDPLKKPLLLQGTDSVVEKLFRSLF